jgi:light-regulated signal transduction histidine kinase (bacteriophytochrome)
MLKAISDQTQKGISSAIQEEDAEEALDEANRKKIIEARTNARLKEAQAEIFRTLLDWHRDLLLLVSGSDKQYLIFAEQSDALQQQAKRQTVSSVLQSIQAIEEMARRMDRNLPALQVFDEAFRKMIRPF